MRVVSLYNVDDWAIHNVGKAVAAAAAEHGVEVELVQEDSYVRSPRGCDVLHLGFLWLYRDGVDYRRHARRLVVTLHDPLEVSNFRDRLDWGRYPLVPLRLDPFDDVSTTSPDMFAALRGRYGLRPYLTPTYPHDAADFIAAGLERAPRTADAPARFTAAIAGPAYETRTEVWNRLRRWRMYARDERGRASARQLTSMFIRTRRKNAPWLDRLGIHLRRLPGASVDFRFQAESAPFPRSMYIRQLAAADVYVCTSYMEGGPLPVMEAVLAGLAVITTPVGQTGSWVRDGENGFVCATYREFVRAAEAYTRDRALLARHQGASRELAAARGFDVTPWLDFFAGGAAARIGSRGRARGGGPRVGSALPRARPSA